MNQSQIQIQAALKKKKKMYPVHKRIKQKGLIQKVKLYFYKNDMIFFDTSLHVFCEILKVAR